MYPRLRTEKIVLGSGPDAPAWWADHLTLGADYEVIAINNAWAICGQRINRWFRSSDFWGCGHVLPEGGDRIRLAQIEVDSHTFTGPYGYTVLDNGIMFLNVAYSLLNEATMFRLPARLWFVGCNFHYPDGASHFYGAGTPDPLRNGLPWLDAELAKLRDIARYEGVELLNATDGESRLPFARGVIQ